MAANRWSTPCAPISCSASLSRCPPLRARAEAQAAASGPEVRRHQGFSAAVACTARRARAATRALLRKRSANRKARAPLRCERRLWQDHSQAFAQLLDSHLPQLLPAYRDQERAAAAYPVKGARVRAQLRVAQAIEERAEPDEQARGVVVELRVGESLQRDLVRQAGGEPGDHVPDIVSLPDALREKGELGRE